MTRRLVAIVACFLALVGEAHAVRFRRPFHPDRGITAAFDNNRGGGLRDYQCRVNTYENHTGTDFGIYFTDVLAMASGTVIGTNDGCNDWGSLGNTCGGRCGNYVRLAFDDGTAGLFCHMKRGSIAVRTGQRVGCGDRLGVSASSGSSTGPHLHVSWIVGGVVRDLYAGPCSNSGGRWTQQRGYLQAPGTDCEVTCACSPGQVQDGPCGRCGTHRRTCGGNCQWGGWGGCTGEGPCAPGQAERQACCDCGSQTRRCNSACRWEGWSECAGPDPAGTPPCDSGKLGACAEGRTRCVTGCLSCVQLRWPSAELCDDVDNDCDGPVDEDSPREMGPVPPAFAATLVDASFPRKWEAASGAVAWAAFKNVGTATWRAREVSLRADAAAEGEGSRLAPPSGWPAYDTAAVLETDVPPGEVGVFRFAVHGSEADADIDERFTLVAPSGRAMACPETSAHVALATLRAGDFTRSGMADGGAASTSVPSGCASAPSTALALLALVVRMARRARP